MNASVAAPRARSSMILSARHVFIALAAAGVLAVGVAAGTALDSGKSGGEAASPSPRIISLPAAGPVITYYIVDSEAMRQRVIEAENMAANERFSAGIPDFDLSYHVLVASTLEEGEAALRQVGLALAEASSFDAPRIFLNDLRGK